MSDGTKVGVWRAARSSQPMTGRAAVAADTRESMRSRESEFHPWPLQSKTNFMLTFLVLPFGSAGVAFGLVYLIAWCIDMIRR